MEEKIRKAYYEENLTFSEIMSMYKIDYKTVLTAIKKGPL